MSPRAALAAADILGPVLLGAVDARIKAALETKDEGLMCHLDVGSKQLQRQCRDAIKAGDMPGYKLGALYHFTRADWLAYLERHRVKPHASPANDVEPRRVPAPSAPAADQTEQRLRSLMGLAGGSRLWARRSRKSGRRSFSAS